MRRWLCAAWICFVPFWAAGSAAAPAQTCIIEAASIPILFGHVDLRVGRLRRDADGYTGTYQLTVSPLGVGSEEGSLSVVLSEDDLRNLAAGTPVDFIGQATNSAGQHRDIHARATPSSINGGALKLRITGGPKKLVFMTTYRLSTP